MKPRVSTASKTLTVVSAILALAGLAMSQTITYKTIKRTPPYSGNRSTGSPVYALFEATWSDGSRGGGYVKPDPNYKPALMPDGQPDIQGIWSITSALLGGGQSVAKGEGPQSGGRGIVDPPGGRIPYQPWARAKASLIAHKYIAPNATCVPGGIPHQLSYLDSQIIQSPGEVLIISEHLTNFRHIPLDGRPHLASDLKLWMGDSRGHWQGNTLVIDVANLNDKTVVDGGLHTDKMHIVERLTAIDRDTLQYEATIEDPGVYERPWKIAFPLVRTPSYELFEEACSDGNRSVDMQIEAGLKLYTGPEDLR